VNDDRSEMRNATVMHSYVSPRPARDPAARRHEMMNALSVIGTIARLVGPRLSQKDRLRMDRLHRAVNRLAELMREEADDEAVARETTNIDVTGLVRRACELLQGRAEEAGVRLVVRCSGGVLRGDRAALQEMLLHLVMSAIEAAVPGQAVDVETRSTPQGDQVWAVRSSGTRMSAEVMRSASVAMSHGGSLAFESREGEGAIVRVWLPRGGTRENVRVDSSRTVRSIIEIPDLRDTA
jgi:signal transduction histidine kinase